MLSCGFLTTTTIAIFVHKKVIYFLIFILQKLHTLFNLHEILVSFKSSKYNEQSLIEMLREIEDMRFKYLTPIRNDIEASKKELDQVKIDINEKKDKVLNYFF